MTHFEQLKAMSEKEMTEALAALCMGVLGFRDPECELVLFYKICEKIRTFLNSEGKKETQ